MFYTLGIPRKTNLKTIKTQPAALLYVRVANSLL